MQIISNLHSHSSFCDGKAAMEIFVQHAIAKGLRSYGFSSHSPLPFITRWSMHAEDLQDYIQEYKRLKNKYADQIELYLGLEIDYLPQEKTAVFDTFANAPLDYRIGSIHYMQYYADGTRAVVDGDYEGFLQMVNELFGGSIKKTVQHYYRQNQNMLNEAKFDILGHMDKVSGNAGKHPDFNIAEKWYVQLVEETMLLAKECGVLVEVNTKALHQKGHTFPKKEYFRFIKDNKIPITVNSDCHLPDLVTSGMAATYEQLKAAGINSIVCMLDGKWQEQNI